MSYQKFKRKTKGSLFQQIKQVLKISISTQTVLELMFQYFQITPLYELTKK